MHHRGSYVALQVLRGHPLVGHQFGVLQGNLRIRRNHAAVIHVVGGVTPHTQGQAVENQQHAAQLQIQAQLLHDFALTPGLGCLAGLHGAAGQNPPILIVRLDQQYLTALITNQRAGRQATRGQGRDKSLQLLVAQVGIPHRISP